MVSFFKRAGARYVPTELASSPWAAGQVSGTALCGLLARQAETHDPGTGFIPGRFTVDLFRPVVAEPIELRSEVVRDGSRVRVVDVSIMQREQLRVRATLMYLSVSAQSPGQVWQPVRQLPVPEQGEWNPLRFKSGELEWTGDLTAGMNGERKCVWHDVVPLVEGEVNSPFQMAAYVADTTNLVCNWGTDGIGYINCDTTLAISRLPVGSEIGLQAQEHLATGGVAIAAATLYDRSGPLGVCVATGVSNVRRVDPASYAAEVAASADEAALNS
ncbi:acyl-CoA thioesterase domain-containing protein [Nocardia sp. NPDC057668]|uniref:acyl-CoA thioesterase domain-containing protein n=1 Tax=Nocardia sp. NPDC057668 TaxID=3346202 RepID=UPI00366BFE5B